MLGGTRARILEALELLSSDADRAAKALGLGVKNRHELEHNLRLRTSGVMPAVARYTGVLYDGIGVDALDAPARAWIDARVSVQSALFGLVSAADRIPAYRLSAGTSLPALGTSMKRVWREAHAALDLPGTGLVLDLRSQGYADLAPMPAAVKLEVATIASDGSTRALNHFNKAAKGDLVRRLAESGARIASVDDLLAWGEAEGLILRRGSTATSMTLLTDLGAPVALRAG